MRKYINTYPRFTFESRNIKGIAMEQEEEDRFIKSIEPAEGQNDDGPVELIGDIEDDYETEVPVEEIEYDEDGNLIEDEEIPVTEKKSIRTRRKNTRRKYTTYR